MSKQPTQKQKSERTEEPEQSPYLGDLTPEYIIWHKANHSEEVHRMRYFDRIPHEYAAAHGIERI